MYANAQVRMDGCMACNTHGILSSRKFDRKLKLKRYTQFHLAHSFDFYRKQCGASVSCASTRPYIRRNIIKPRFRSTPVRIIYSVEIHCCCRHHHRHRCCEYTFLWKTCKNNKSSVESSRVETCTQRIHNTTSAIIIIGSIDRCTPNQQI